MSLSLNTHNLNYYKIKYFNKKAKEPKLNIKIIPLKYQVNN